MASSGAIVLMFLLGAPSRMRASNHSVTMRRAFSFPVFR